MLDKEQKTRHLKFIEALGVKVGDTIEIPNWHILELREDGFYHNEIFYRKGYVNAYNIIIERGFKIIS